jgi:hypothetical protein
LASVAISVILITSSTASAFEAASSNASPFRFAGDSSPLAPNIAWKKRVAEVAEPLLSMPPSKRPHNIEHLRCRGMHDNGILTQLERICEDCYNLYKDAEVHAYCRMDCFSSQTFRQCLQSLLMDKESDIFLELVQIIGKKKRRRKR